MVPDKIEKPTIQLFIAYSRRDTDMLGELVSHLSVLERNKTVDRIWYDGLIEAGYDWEEEIKTNLQRSDIILLLISAEFIASEYCYGKEMKDALSLHEQGKSRVIPILLRPCVWEDTPFAKLQALPNDGIPITNASDRDPRFVEITRGIRDVASEIFENKEVLLKEVRKREEEARQQEEEQKRKLLESKMRAARKHLKVRNWEKAKKTFEEAVAVEIVSEQELINEARSGIEMCEMELGYLRALGQAKSYFDEGKYTLAYKSYNEAYSLKEAPELQLDIKLSQAFQRIQAKDQTYAKEVTKLEKQISQLKSENSALIKEIENNKQVTHDLREEFEVVKDSLEVYRTLATRLKKIENNLIEIQQKNQQLEKNLTNLTVQKALDLKEKNIEESKADVEIGKKDTGKLLAFFPFFGTSYELRRWKRLIKAGMYHKLIERVESDQTKKMGETKNLQTILLNVKVLKMATETLNTKELGVDSLVVSISDKILKLIEEDLTSLESQDVEESL